MREAERFMNYTHELPDGQVFDPMSGEIRLGLQTLQTLTLLESKAFDALVANTNNVVGYEELWSRLYPYEASFNDYERDIKREQTVIRRLRAKLKAISPEFAARIQTFTSRGYRWTVDILPPPSS